MNLKLIIFEKKMEAEIVSRDAGSIEPHVHMFNEIIYENMKDAPISFLKRSKRMDGRHV